MCRYVCFVHYNGLDWGQGFIKQKNTIKGKKIRNFVVFLESVFVQLFYILLITFNVPLVRM